MHALGKWMGILPVPGWESHEVDSPPNLLKRIEEFHNKMLHIHLITALLTFRIIVQYFESTDDS